MGDMTNHKGIEIPFGFKLWADKPIDVRFSVNTIAERDDMVLKHAVYYGLQVYVKDTDKTYKYCKDGTWKNMDDSAVADLNDKLSISGSNCISNNAKIRFGNTSNASYIVGNGTTGTIGLYTGGNNPILTYSTLVGEAPSESSSPHGVDIAFTDDAFGHIRLNSSGNINLAASKVLSANSSELSVISTSVSIDGDLVPDEANEGSFKKELSINIGNGNIIYSTDETGSTSFDVSRILLKANNISAGYLDGRAKQADKLTNARHIIIGTADKVFDGSEDVVFSDDEVGSVRTGGLNKTFDDTALLAAIMRDQGVTT